MKLKWYVVDKEYIKFLKKFDDKVLKNKVINAKTPKEASIIGRDRNNKLKNNWKNIKC